MSNLILVEVRNVYGNELVYPANDTAKTFARIAGTTTLKHDTLALAEKLGYVIEIAPNKAEALLAARFAGAR